MKILKVLGAILVAPLLCGQGFAVEIAGVSPESKAASSVVRYLYALAGGNVEQMKESLAPAMLKGRDLQLSNPDYPHQLSEAYSQASFEIMDSELEATGEVRVDARIDLSGRDSVYCRFFLRETGGQFLIEREE